MGIQIDRAREKSGAPSGPSIFFKYAEAWAHVDYFKKAQINVLKIHSVWVAGDQARERKVHLDIRRGIHNNLWIAEEHQRPRIVECGHDADVLRVTHVHTHERLVDTLFCMAMAPRNKKDEKEPSHPSGFVRAEGHG